MQKSIGIALVVAVLSGLAIGLGGDHRITNGCGRDGGTAGVDGRAAHAAELEADCRAGTAEAGDVGDFAEGVR